MTLGNFEYFCGWGDRLVDVLRTPVGFLFLESVLNIFANGVTGLWTRQVRPLGF